MKKEVRQDRPERFFEPEANVLNDLSAFHQLSPDPDHALAFLSRFVR